MVPDNFARFLLAFEMRKCLPGLCPVLFRFRPRPITEPSSVQLSEAAFISSKTNDGASFLYECLKQARPKGIDCLKIPKRAEIKLKSK